MPATSHPRAAATRRLLGLDGINARTGRSRFKAADGERPVLDHVTLLN
jgi:hypothetical protein